MGTTRISTALERIQSWDKKTLEGIRFLLFTLIAADLFGIFWYLNQKKLGMAILIVIIALLVIILLLERRQEDLNPEKKMLFGDNEEGTLEEPSQPVVEGDSSSEGGLFGDLGISMNTDIGLDSGLPNSEDYNKNLNEAFGTVSLL